MVFISDVRWWLVPGLVLVLTVPAFGQTVRPPGRRAASDWHTGSTLPLPEQLPPGRAAPVDRPLKILPESSSVPRRDLGSQHPTSLETLQQAWAIALAVDQRLAASARNVDVAHSTLDVASAERLPWATVTGDYTIRDNERAFRYDSPLLPYTATNPYMPRNNFSFAGRVSVPIYTGGTLSEKIAASAADVSAEQLGLSTVRQQLMIQVAREYIGVLRAEQDLEVAESHERSLAAHARDIQAGYDCQRIPKIDLLAAQVALANSRHHVIRAENQVDIARAVYNRRLGRPLSMSFRLARVHFDPPTQDVDQLTRMAIASRPELAQLDARIEALKHRVEAVLGENRAQVRLDGGYAFQENRYQTPQGITSAGVGVSWNLFDGGRVRSRANVYLKQVQAVTCTRADLQSRIQLDVRRAWLDTQESWRRIDVTREAVGRAEENWRVTRHRYRRGLSTNTDVLNAEVLRVVALQNYNNSMLDAVLTTLELKRTIGAL